MPSHLPPQGSPPTQLRGVFSQASLRILITVTASGMGQNNKKIP